MYIVNKYHKEPVSSSSLGVSQWPVMPVKVLPVERALDFPILAKRQTSLNVEQLSNDGDQQGTLHMPNTMHVEKLLSAQF